MDRVRGCSYSDIAWELKSLLEKGDLKAKKIVYGLTGTSLTYLVGFNNSDVYLRNIKGEKIEETISKEEIIKQTIKQKVDIFKKMYSQFLKKEYGAKEIMFDDDEGIHYVNL